MRRAAAVVGLWSLVSIPAVDAEPPDVAELVRPLQQFEPFFGAWVPDPTSRMVQENPDLADDVAFMFEWAAEDRKTVRFFEGIPDGDRSKRILECLVAVDPRDGAVVFLGFQHRDGFLYRGSFDFEDRGYVRLYEVSYAQEIRKTPVRYRDRCRLVDRDTLECLTEQRDGDGWKPWGAGEPFRMLRKTRDGG